MAPVSIVGDGLRAAVLKSADHSRIAGWVLNKRYNWKEVKERGVPAAAAGATIVLPGVRDGVYRVRWSDCKTGALVLETAVTAAGQELRLDCPSIEWDLSFVAERMR